LRSSDRYYDSAGSGFRWKTVQGIMGLRLLTLVLSAVFDFAD
jgi:hypothetical protein